MRIGVPKEIMANEARVAATPQTVIQLQKLGFEVSIEAGAGELASFSDIVYQEVGATVVSADQIWQNDIILKVNAPTLEISDGEAQAEVDKLQSGSTIASFIWPAQNEALLAKLAERKVSVLAMDSVPRISRAQSLDALSSMANIAGYRAVIEAAHHFGRFFTGQITAAGKVPPAKVLVAGAGVAGLAAIGAASSLGAIVRGFDVRPEVKEQVESMGAEFLEVDVDMGEASTDGYAKEMSEAFNEAATKLYADQAKDVDIIITTALIPGRPAPKLISEDMIDNMKPGSVIVDLAAANGGNCGYTVADKVITTANGVTIIGYTDMVSRLPAQSSQLYGTNLVNLLKLLSPEKNGEISLDFSDDVIRGVSVVKEGEVTWPAPPIKVSAAPQAKVEPAPVIAKAEPKKAFGAWLPLLMAGALIAFMGRYAPPEFLAHFTVFLLACVVGYYVVWNVSHSLHTPLMSVTNAISGIIIVGALLQIGQAGWLVSALSFVAILVASINIFGGFTVTQRMLKMFRKN